MKKQQTIESISALCPLIGGLAVYKARSLLYLYNDSVYFDNYEICGLQGLQYRMAENLIEEKEVDLNIFPNPTNGSFTLELKLSKDEIFDLIIYNSLGQIIEKELITTETNKLDFDSKNLSSGLYLVVLKSKLNSKTYKKKLVYEN